MERLSNVERIEKIRKLSDQNKYEDALKLVRNLDVSKIRSLPDLSAIADVYEANGCYEEAYKILQRVYQKTKTRRILYQLTVLSVRRKNTAAAKRYYKEYLVAAPNGADQYVLRFLISRLEKRSLADQIDCLQRLKEHEYAEEWAYELAKLYNKAGLKEKCIRECNDIILWFGSGTVVEKAEKLKAACTGEEEKSGRLMKSPGLPEATGELPEMKAEYFDEIPAVPERDRTGEDLKPAAEPESNPNIKDPAEIRRMKEERTDAGSGARTERENMMPDPKDEESAEKPEITDGMPEPAAEESGETEPGETEPGGTESEETGPGGIEPEETESGETEPEETEPEETEPRGTESKETEPGGTKTKETEPGETEPEKTEPGGTEPEKTGPEETEPEETELEKTGPEESESDETGSERIKSGETEPKEIGPAETGPEETDAAAEPEKEDQPEAAPVRAKKMGIRPEDFQAAGWRDPEPEKEISDSEEDWKYQEEELARFLREQTAELEGDWWNEEEPGQVESKQEAPESKEGPDQNSENCPWRERDTDGTGDWLSRAWGPPVPEEPAWKTVFMEDELNRIAVKYLEEEDYILTEEAMVWLEEAVERVYAETEGEDRKIRMAETARRITERADRRNMRKLSEIVKKSSYRESGLLFLQREDFEDG